MPDQSPFAGPWSGTFSGSSSGTWQGTVASNYALTGTATPNGSSVPFTGTISTTGFSTLGTQGSVGNGNITFKGGFFLSGTSATANGTWVAVFSASIGGTWSGSGSGT